jgi:protease PrsW
LLNPERNPALVLIPVGLASIMLGSALLIATTAVYFLSRNRMRAAAQAFSSAPGQG